MTIPKRIQRKRTKGWRMPEGAVYVGRPSRWGNPFRVGEIELFVNEDNRLDRKWISTKDAAAAVENFRWLMRQERHREQVRAELAGRDLACWCPLEDAGGIRVPCHADVLLELANPGWMP